MEILNIIEAILELKKGKVGYCINKGLYYCLYHTVSENKNILLKHFFDVDEILSGWIVMDPKDIQEKKIDPCFFCDSTVCTEKYHELPLSYFIFCRNESCCYSGPLCSSEHEAIEQHNRKYSILKRR